MDREQRYKARRQARLELHATRGPILAGDVALTVGLIFAAMIALPIVTTLTTLLAGVSAGCTDQACVVTTGAGVGAGVLLPLLTFLVGATVSVVRLFRHRRGWKTAAATVGAVVLCLPLAAGLLLVGAAL